MAQEVTGPVPFCLVTGTSAGLGLAVAEELLRRGWDVTGVARAFAVNSVASI